MKEDFKWRWRGGGERRKEGEETHFPLEHAHARQIVRVVDTASCGRRRAQLAALGILPGAVIKVCCNLGGPLVIEVRGSRLSLGRGVARKILVKPWGEAGECTCPGEAVCDERGRTKE